MKFIQIKVYIRFHSTFCTVLQYHVHDFAAGKKTPPESVRLAECIGEVRALLHQILSDTVPLTTKSKGKTRTSKSEFSYVIMHFNLTYILYVTISL